MLSRLRLYPHATIENHDPPLTVCLTTYATGGGALIVLAASGEPWATASVNPDFPVADDEVALSHDWPQAGEVLTRAGLLRGPLRRVPCGFLDAPVYQVQRGVFSAPVT